MQGTLDGVEVRLDHGRDLDAARRGGHVLEARPGDEQDDALVAGDEPLGERDEQAGERDRRGGLGEDGRRAGERGDRVEDRLLGDEDAGAARGADRPSAP